MQFQGGGKGGLLKMEVGLVVTLVTEASAPALAVVEPAPKARRGRPKKVAAPPYLEGVTCGAV